MFSLLSAVFLVLPAVASASPSAQIDSASGQIFVTVENMSGSAFAGARVLEVVSDFPTVALTGDVHCGANFYGDGDLTAVGAVFEDPTWFDSTTLWNHVGASVKLAPSGTGSMYPLFDFDYTFPTGGEDSLVSLGLFQPATVVESALQDHVDLGGTAEDFLRDDRVIAVPLMLFLTATCEMPTPGGGYTMTTSDAADVTAYILYTGDPSIIDPLQVVVQTPNTVQAPASSKPPRRARR